MNSKQIHAPNNADCFVKFFNACSLRDLLQIGDKANRLFQRN